MGLSLALPFHQDLLHIEFNWKGNYLSPCALDPVLRYNRLLSLKSKGRERKACELFNEINMYQAFYAGRNATSNFFKYFDTHNPWEWILQVTWAKKALWSEWYAIFPLPLDTWSCNFQFAKSQDMYCSFVLAILAT